MSASPSLNDSFVRRTLVVVGLVTAVILVLIFAWQILHILLLLFIGILLALFLSGISGWIRERTPLSHRAALFITVLVLLTIVGLGGWLAAPNLVEQGEQLTTNLQASVENVQAALADQAWAQPILDRLPSPAQIDPTPTAFMSRVFGVFSRTLDMVINVVVILSVGLYLALEPDLYANGLIRLVPKSHRQRAGEVLDELAYTMRWWLIGRLASMVIIGVFSVVGLYLLGIPLAFVLGFLAGLLTFIPIIGPLLALIFPLLIAFTISPMTAVYVALIYLGIELVEGYFLSPVIQQRTVALAPVLLILSQVIFGYFFSFIGLVVAAPIIVMLMTLVKMLYVIDLLGDEEIKLLKENPEPRFDASLPNNHE